MRPCRQSRRCDRSVMLEAATVRGALRAHRDLDTPFVSINLTPTTILSRRTLGLLPDRLDKLAIEISEQELAASESDLVEALAQLRHRGARIVIDGVGGSGRALDQIVRLRPDAVKLDRSVIARTGMDPDTATLIDVFTAVTKRVGATLWADGVDTAMQERALVDLGLVYAHVT
jgi:EAL domain-containing protein (putative c-di-GMP-specific phosphodiesterase class I)